MAKRRNPKPQRFSLTTSGGHRVEVEIREQRALTEVTARGSAAGPDFAELRRWLAPLLQRYEHDNLPLALSVEGTPWRFTGYDNGVHTVELVEPGTPHAAPQNFLGPLAKLSAALGDEPGIQHVTVLHDDWCPMLRGGPCCSCNPVVRYGRPDGSDVH